MSDWKAQLRSELDLLGERAVRDDMNHGGGLGTGGENRKQVVREWLTEQEAKRESRERAAFDLAQRTFDYTRWTYMAAVAALVATIIGIIVTLLHL
jgi:hypothetical protein